MTIKHKTAPFNFLNLYQNSEDFKKSRFFQMLNIEYCISSVSVEALAAH